MTIRTKNAVPPISNHPQQKQTSRSTDQESDLGYVSGDTRADGSAESMSESELETELEFELDAEPGPEAAPDRIYAYPPVDSDGDNDDEINNDVTSPKFPEVEDELVPTELIPLLPPE